MPQRVLTVSPMPPEKSAYALARYSRSPDSIRQSLEWVRAHSSEKFLESFYFDYGHASIADLGHLTLCLEGISELAATEVEDEQLWDGQARSSRYQDFSRSGFITPPEFSSAEAALYAETAQGLLRTYQSLHARMKDHIAERHPLPGGMKPDTYQRNISARAFDVARYVLFFGIPTGVGQITSIRTLERQIGRLKASPYRELRELAAEMAQACAQPPACPWSPSDAAEPVAPTLARHTSPDRHASQSRLDLTLWAEQNLPAAPEPSAAPVDSVDLCPAPDTLTDIAVTLLYPVTTRPYRDLLQQVAPWSAARKREVIGIATQSRSRYDELLRNFRTCPYIFDIVMDIGAYRDLHRHRRCQQFRQAFSTALGYATPPAIHNAGLESVYHGALEQSFSAFSKLPAPGSHYLLPFATNSRFLFKMDFAQAEYICRQRSGVKGHFSYRQIAWNMKEKLGKLEPDLAHLLEATPPWVEDPLQR